nr:glycosyltransferase family 4 protein [Mycetohabitans endofungorum]
MHNYHNVLSPSILPVIDRYRSSLGYTTYLTCHDYHLVHYNPTLLRYENGIANAFPIESLGTLPALITRASPKGAVHDALKKLYWHSTRLLCHPARVFDLLLCPSRYMEQALHRAGIMNTSLLPNPIDADMPICAPKPIHARRINLAFAGRIAAEKGLNEFIALARATQFAYLNKLTIFGDGPERAALEHRNADLICAGQLEFRGRRPHRALLAELRETAHAVVLPSICAENAPLSIVEAAMLGLPALVHDIGSLSTFGDAIGNKFKYRCDTASYRAALDALIRHLGQPNRRYDVGEYHPQRYAQRLATVLRLERSDEQPEVTHAGSVVAADGGAFPIG